jgi:methylmalonyl-CoA/ethylmalonyl-CoA epimerase
MDNKEHKPLPFLKDGIGQVAILVPDLMEAIRHYHEDFGIGPWDIYTYRKPLVREMSYHGEPADYSMRIGLSYFGPMRVELIQPLTGNTVYADFIAEHGYGVHHFGLLVDDMDSALEEARAAGYEMTMDGSGFGLDGDGHYAYLDTEDRLGVTLELIERPKRRHKPEAVYPPKE